MAFDPLRTLRNLRERLCVALIGPHALAFLPAIALSAYWFGGEMALLWTAVATPVIYVALGGFSQVNVRSLLAHDGRTGLLVREAFDAIVEQTRAKNAHNTRQSCVFDIEIDDFQALRERHGEAAGDLIVRRAGERIVAAMRQYDSVARLGDCRFGVCLGTTTSCDLETCLQMAARMQSAIEEPISVDGISVYVSAAIGFCLSGRAPGNDGTDWSAAAAIALRSAQKRGPNAIRAFTDEMRRISQTRAALREEVFEALENGRITPWFQPQISTDTGKVSGFEALARWHHPERGMIPPLEFLPAIEQEGLLERLFEVIMYHSFAALKAWDAAGLDIPHVGVNFSGDELNNPRLVDKVNWELDRFDLSANRLAVEILETVIAGAPDDLQSRNINGLAALGCRVDLDDFGTGHASIAAIRRFRVNRIKIDRSFVMKADMDPDQQRMISAILTMAERLNIETLAEGVETVGEHALLSQLGCDHVQGFGIGKPMPFEDTLTWIATHEAKLQDAPEISSRTRPSK